MEIFSEDMARLRKMVEDWHTHPEIELESTFGPKGAVDMQTFLRVASRLKAKGFEAIQQEERLTIRLPDQVRFTLVGTGIIQQYCRTETLAGREFTALIKDRATSGDDANVDLRDYDVRIKVRREVPLAKDDSRITSILAQWPQQRKYFRIIRRWTFSSPAFKGLTFDLSMVRSTQVNRKTGLEWVKSFKEQELYGTLPKYEIEVELNREEFSEAAPEDALKSLLQGIGEVLRGIQGTPVLIRKTKKTQVLESYKALTGTDRFRGVPPVTLEVKNMVADGDPGVPNLRRGYNVTDKADGLRCHGFVDDTGELFMIDMAMNVLRTGLSKPECRNSLLDGEYVTTDKTGKGIQHFLIFDMYYAPEGKDVTKLPFQNGRHEQLKQWFTKWQSGEGPKKLVKSAGLLVALKSFYFAEPGLEIFTRKASMVLNNEKTRIYNTDGLIFTPNDSPLPQKPGDTFWEQFKWKPAEDNTIDFLVNMEKDVELKNQDKITIGIRPDTGKAVRFKTLRLFVGSARDPRYSNPRGLLLFEQQLPEAGTKEYKPVLFNPSDHADTMANVCYLETEEDPDTGEEFVKAERTGEPIRDKSIVEMRYDANRPAGWRWVPIRVRTDKTERLMKGILARTLNSEKTAEGVWNSIHEPVTDHMIRTGDEQPSEEEQKTLAAGSASKEFQTKYWERKASAADLLKVRGLRDFHNKYIKEELLYGTLFDFNKDPTGEARKTIVDLAVGRAADINRWRRGGAGFVFGIDIVAANILDPKDGAYRRLLNVMIERQESGGKALPVRPTFFTIGDASKRIVTGEAGANEEEANMMRSIFGRVAPTGPVPPLVEEKGANVLRAGADGVVCMFALHYLFKDEATFNGFLQNIDDTLKIGGLFLGVAFDGQAVFDLLRGVKKDEVVSGVDEDSTIWEITKRYEAEELPTDETGFGYPIDVNFISIGTEHTEYLIPWELLVKKMRSIGCELLSDDDLRQVGLKHSTNMLEDSYKMAQKAGKKYFMSDPVKQYSFLNRWFIFKRVRTGQEAVLEAEEGQVAPAVAAEVGVGEGAVESGAEGVAEGAVEGAEAAAAVPPINQGPLGKKVFTPREIFNFYQGSPSKEAQWLSPTALFPIVNPSNPADVYPTMEHYMAGMKLVRASNKPDLGPAIFGINGTIHQKHQGERTKAGIKGQLTEETEAKSYKAEFAEVKDMFERVAAREKVTFDEALWSASKQDVIDGAISQRLTNDKKFCQVVGEAVRKGLYLLYYTRASASELGGQRRADGTIDGQNKIGVSIMRQVYANPAGVQKCATGS